LPHNPHKQHVSQTQTVSQQQQIKPLKTWLCTTFALIAFAANSVLCRLALKGDEIDPSSFTAVRLVAGAIVLVAILKITSRQTSKNTRGSWGAALMLFLYAVTFSFAYMSLDTGTGALVLFGSVQLTIVLIGYFRGTRLRVLEWLGMAVAFGGLIYLVLPGVTAPSIIGFILMAVAGAAWGIYTLSGRGSLNPLMDTTFNFMRTIPLVAILAIVVLEDVQLSTQGILLAVISGGITSGIGYTIWYTALGGLSATEAAVVQLAVPVIAAIGGVIFVAEIFSQRLVISTVLTLGGILMVTLGRLYLERLSRSSKT